MKAGSRIRRQIAAFKRKIMPAIVARDGALYAIPAETFFATRLENQRHGRNRHNARRRHQRRWAEA